MGTFARSWQLFGQSFALLKSDKELMWLPILSALFCLAATVIIFSSAFIVLGPVPAMLHDAARQKLLYQHAAPFVFLFYVVTYAIAIFFNVALVSIASNRLAGGDAKLDYGLQVAWQRKWRILEWALLAATVGMILRALERRLSFLGRIVIGIIGFVWSLASFFVAPVLAAEDMGPFDALYKSAGIFRETWGEEVVGGFSFGAIFMVLALPAVILPILGVRYGPTAMFVGLGIMLIYWLLLGVINSAAQGIFVAALYRYATTHEVSGGFDRTDLSSAWQPKQ